MANGFQLGAVAAGAGRLVSRLRRLLGGIRTAISRIPLTSASGRMTAMHTTRSPAEITSAADIFTLSDRTTWSYDQPTGLLTNKLYADGKGTAYTYTPDGKLATRTWARGVTTTYAYTNASSLAAIDYSDSTPDVAFTYDRLGRMVSAIVDGISTNAYTYDSETLALSVETQNGLEINRTTDALGRPSGFTLDDDYAVSYAYDMFGRFHSITGHWPLVTGHYTYSYLPGADHVSGMTTSSGFLWTRAYESARSLITSVENRHGETVISRYDYTNDQLGRRTHRADSGLAFANPAFDAYSYNGRSEVIGAQRYHGTDVSDTSTVYGGRQFGYVYDPIGNRTSASETIGGETLAKAYTANALNQYTAIANPDAVGLRGDATNTAAVTVNGLPVQSDTVSSDTIPWHFALEADNANGPDFPLAEIVAVVNPPGTNTPDIVSTASGHLYAPPRSETLTYDADGNLTSDGRWQYTWNGENRLIKAEELVSPTNRQPYTVEYAYDHQGRMVWKQVSTNAVVLSTRTLLWDGYNIIRETINHQLSTTNYYTWGLDLSGSLQGAGGVGGLLAEVKDGAPYFAAFDANGNVTEYVGTNGLIAAHREYDPFGGTVVYTSAATNQQSEISFTHWFSTKPWCPVVGLSEYQYRKYSPTLGRWLSRDPIGEKGGANLHSMAANGLTSKVDKFGLSYDPPVISYPSLPGGPSMPGYPIYTPGNPIPPIAIAPPPPPSPPPSTTPASVPVKCCGSTPYNPIQQCCCASTEKVFDISEPFAWSGTIAYSEAGYYLQFTAMNCNLNSNTRSDCKRFEANITAFLGGLTTGVAVGGVVSKIAFKNAPSFYEGFNGGVSFIGAGAAITVGLSGAIVRIGDGVAYPMGGELGFELPAIAVLIGHTVDVTGHEIPCEKW